MEVGVWILDYLSFSRLSHREALLLSNPIWAYNEAGTRQPTLDTAEVSFVCCLSIVVQEENTIAPNRNVMKSAKKSSWPSCYLTYKDSKTCSSAWYERHCERIRRPSWGLQIWFTISPEAILASLIFTNTQNPLNLNFLTQNETFLCGCR